MKHNNKKIEELEEYKAIIHYANEEDMKAGIGTVNGNDLLLEKIILKINEIINLINKEQ